MPMMIRVTKKLIESGANPPAGFTKAQLAILGIKWPARKGWKTRLWKEPHYITQEQAALYLPLKGSRSKASRETSLSTGHPCG